MTTRLEQLQATLPPDVLDKFLKNVRDAKGYLVEGFLHAEIENPSIKDIIRESFVWAYTPEGFEYWNSIAEQPWEPQQLTVGDINAQIADELNDEIVQLADPTVLNEPIQPDAYTAPEPTPTVPEDITSSKDFHAKVPPYEFTEARNILDLSDMHREIYTGLIIQDATPYAALIKAGKAVEEYTKYLKEKHGS